MSLIVPPEFRIEVELTTRLYALSDGRLLQTVNLDPYKGDVANGDQVILHHHIPIKGNRIVIFTLPEKDQ
jgi:hypothetical protein